MTEEKNKEKNSTRRDLRPPSFSYNSLPKSMKNGLRSVCIKRCKNNNNNNNNNNDIK